MSANNNLTLPVLRSDGELQALDHLTPVERQEANQLAQGLNVRDALAVTAFGVKPQRDMSALTDPVMKLVMTKDTGAAGEVLTTLLHEIKALDAGSFAAKTERGLSRLPLVGRLFNRIRQFVSQYEKIGTKIDRITVELDRSKNILTRDIALLDKLYEQNSAFFRQLLTYVAAGELKLDAMRVEHAQMTQDPQETHDPVVSQRAADLANIISRLERRVHDLKLTTMISLQSAPQLRLVQNGNQALVEKIQSSILTTIPLWKSQIIIAIALFDQKKGLALQQQVSKTTNELLVKNAEMLQQGTTGIARETERGIVEIETLREVNQKLIDTIEETIQIQSEGQRKRSAVETELAHLQRDLRNTLGAIKSS
jgi:uncharacterized protein YaaN involved in tellurite resistance